MTFTISPFVLGFVLGFLLGIALIVVFALWAYRSKKEDEAKKNSNGRA